jgi:hypothetical protein
MAKKRACDIGAEILEGIQEIKRGEAGRVVIYPPSPEPVPPRSMPEGSCQPAEGNDGLPSEPGART